MLTAIELWSIKHKYFLWFLAGATVFLLWLSRAIWPINDEYLYATIGRSIAASISEQTVLLSDINTEHTPLFPFIIAGVVWLTSNDHIYFLRLINIGFTLGALIVYYRILLKLGLRHATATVTLCALLLVADFWVNAIRLTLVAPSVFCFGLLVYWLLNGGSKIKISLALLTLLLFNEYYYFLAAGFLLVYETAYWIVPAQQSRWIRLREAVATIITAVLPATLMIFFLLDFNLLPYPRLLENSLREILSDSFLFAHQQLVKLLSPLIHYVNYPYPVTDAVTSAVATVTDPTATNMVTASAVETISTATTNQGAMVSDNIQFTGNLLSSNIIDSPIPEINRTDLLKKYTYNLSDIYLHPLVLVFAAHGVIVRCFAMARTRWRLEHIQSDIIFLLLLTLFLFFNLQQGGTEHGFRILMPMLPALLYFLYHSLARLLQGKATNPEYVLVLTMFSGAIYVYWHNVSQFVYRSTLTRTGFLAEILNYKPIIFIALFCAAFLFVMFYHRFRTPYKMVILALFLAGFWGIKFIPYYASYKVDMDYFGYEYSLAAARPYLRSVQNQGIISNLYFHKSYYLTETLQIPNTSATPGIRNFSQAYPNLNYNLGEHFEDNVVPHAAREQAGYVFLYQEFYGQEYIDSLNGFLEKYKLYLTPIKEYAVNGKYQWGLYAFDHERYTADHPA